MQSQENWSEFVKAHLHVGDVLDGVIVLTKQGDTNLLMWQRKRSGPESTICRKGFILQTANDDQEIKYIIYSKNFCSVYAMSRHNRSGILVCSLPYGILVATYSFPCTSVKAIEIVENACELLRG